MKVQKQAVEKESWQAVSGKKQGSKQEDRQSYIINFHFSLANSSKEFENRRTS